MDKRLPEEKADSAAPGFVGRVVGWRHECRGPRSCRGYAHALAAFDKAEDDANSTDIFAEAGPGEAGRQALDDTIAGALGCVWQGSLHPAAGRPV